MSVLDSAIKDLVQAFKEFNKNKTSPYDTQAEVKRVEGNIAWVHIPGGVDETPVKLTMNAQVGDVVQVRVAGGRAWLTGNATSPPTDDKVANQAMGAATSAQQEVLTVKEVVTESIKATKAQFEYVEADTAKIHNLEADEIHAGITYTNELIADGITAENIIADHAIIGSLDANYAHITNGVIDNASIDYADVENLDAHYAEIDLANVNNAWIQNGVVKDAAITDAKILGVSANKLTAGTIDASNIIVTNLNADNITAGTLNGQRIGTGSLSLDKLSEEVPTKNYVDNIAENLQGQIDGQIETWTGTVVPTLNNSPASAWTTADERHKHVGDIYYVVNAGATADGYTYRFTESGTTTKTYSWTLIKDNQITKALQDILDIQGDISDIQTFDSQISSWKTDTNSELSSLKSRTSTLETGMGNKVDTSTFNQLSQTVDENSANITSLTTTVSNKADSSTVTTLSNTINTVSQKADSNSSKITSLTQTLGTNADGTTKTGDIVHRTSAVEQDLSGFKTTVSETYATKATVNDKADASTVYTKSEIDQTVSGINASVSAKADGQETTAALALKANKETLTSEINASADTVKINASRVQVDGNLIVGKSQMDSAIGDAVDALESDISNAAKTATDYITYINATDGIKVHNANDSSNYAQINSDGMQVVKSGLSVAEFGETSRIGKEDESHIQIDYHSIQLKDKEGNTYFHVSDLRDRDDDYKATFKEYFTGNGNRTVFKVSNKVTDTVSVVDGSDTENTATLSPIYEKALTFDPTKDYYTIIATYVDNPKERNFDTYYSRAVYSQFSDVTCYSPSSPPYDQNNDYYTVAGTLVESPTAENLSAYYTAVPRIYTFANTPADGADITITYKTDYVVAKAYTLGRRVADSGIGVYSVVEGESNIASGRGTHVEGIFNKGVGQYSHAEGMSNSVDGWYSHVEGNRNIASGYACHAEGYQTYSTGRGSHAEGEGTYAANRAQHSLGSYNDVDTLPISSPPVHPSGDRSYGHYALIIGNGTSNSNRSNAFAVDWNGDIYPQNTKMADFVVEQGTDSNNWTYRKWNSGIAECWKNTAPKTTVTSGWGSGYLSTQFSMSFPSGLFVEAPRVHLANNESYLAIPLGYKPTKDNIKYQLFRPTSVTTAQQFSIDFYAIGKWK